MKNRSQTIELIIETAREIEELNVHQMINLMREQQVSELDINRALKQINRKPNSVILFPTPTVPDLA